MDASPRPKQAACLVCRRSKIKCEGASADGRCKRCVQLNCECVRPDFHAGRQKGIKNKRVGLDKALYQIEQAVKRARGAQKHSADDVKVMTHLRDLLGDVDAAETSPSQASASQRRSYGDTEEASSSGDDDGEDNAGAASMNDFVHRTEESLAIDDAENPLQLLARASYIQPSSDSRSRPSPQVRPGSHQSPGQADESAALEEFFTSTHVSLDVGDDIDPITLGLVTQEEAETLFSYFHANLAHTRWGLDPRIHSVSFTRTRSAFLCTSVMAASALFMPSAAALSKRLSNHVKTLAQRVMLRRHKSVEIVLAFMINIPWMFLGRHSTDDEACVYISMATSIAIDLSLHKVLVPTELLQQGSELTLARGECLDTRMALAIDGFPDVEPWSDTGKLLLRNRERCWISLFVLERGMSLARGRPFAVPVTRVIKDCDNWHRTPQSDVQDGALVSMAVLRRNLDGLFSTVRSLCDGSQNATSDGSLIAQSIQGAIERFFDQWLTEWGVSIGIGPQRRLPPYVEILVTHTRLSTYGGIINHPTAPTEVRRFFRTAGLSSALNVMRAAIQGESQLQSMPNNTTIMISFAACFALTLSTYTTGSSTLAPSIRKLIDEAAGVLERIGTVTEHRNGLSLLYGKYLRQIVKKAAVEGASAPAHQASSVAAPHMPVGEPVPAQPSFMAQQQLLWPEPLQFSAMSDDQIAHVLNQPGNEFEPSFGGLSWADMNNFDWLYWPEF
ncbi:transcriptional regulator family: Fungal Specific TF [Purpureocillium lilacinum]|uniref:Transcriptional regulator family: Fungal Specific TF n=1 Tax=Purpureocillium lilacinum TaxID=33203 RepID=A0ABR0CB06_PURLI|nr:transcriptional regulator family: Fungal Specific TF [Purpureocillium lilacinum]